MHSRKWLNMYYIWVGQFLKNAKWLQWYVLSVFVISVWMSLKHRETVQQHIYISFHPARLQGQTQQPYMWFPSLSGPSSHHHFPFHSLACVHCAHCSISVLCDRFLFISGLSSKSLYIWFLSVCVAVSVEIWSQLLMVIWTVYMCTCKFKFKQKLPTQRRKEMEFEFFPVKPRLTWSGSLASSSFWSCP